MRTQQDAILRRVQNLNHSDLAQAEIHRIDLQGQLNQAEECILERQLKRNELAKTCSEEKIKLQKLTIEVENLTEQINGSVIEQHMDVIRYIDVELSQLRSFKNVVDDLLQNKRSQLNAIHLELKDRHERTSVELEQLLKDTSSLQIENSSEAFFKKLNLIEDAAVSDGSERAILIGDGIIQERCTRETVARTQRLEHIRRMNRNRLKVIEDLEKVQLNKSQKQTSSDIQEEGLIKQGQNHSGSIENHLLSENNFGMIQAKITEHRLRLSEDIQLLKNLQRPSKLKSESRVQLQNVHWEIRQLLQESILPSIIENAIQASISLEEIEQKESLLLLQNSLNSEKEQGYFMQTAIFEIWQEFFDSTVKDFLQTTAKDALNECLLIYETWKAQCFQINKTPITKELSCYLDELIRIRPPSPDRMKLYQNNSLKATSRTNLQDKNKENAIIKTIKAFTKSSASVNKETAKIDFQEEKNDSRSRLYANFSAFSTASCKSYIDFENDFFNNHIEILPRMIAASGKSGFLSGQETSDDNVLLLAGSDGSIQLISTLSETEAKTIEMILGPSRNRRWKCIHSGPWSLMHQIAAITDRHQVFVLDRFGGNPQSVVELSPDDILGAREVEKKEKNSTPDLAIVHPAVTFTLSSPSFLIAWNSGSIIRWNKITSSRQLLVGSFPEDRPEILSDTSPSLHLTRNTRRQRYEGHRSPIIMLGFHGYAKRIDNLVSIDTNGLICIWDDDFVSGFGHIVPKQQFQLKVVDVWYEDMDRGSNHVVFSNETKDKGVNSLHYEHEIRQQLTNAKFSEHESGVFYPPAEDNNATGYRHRFIYQANTNVLDKHVKEPIKIWQTSGKLLQAKMTVSKREVVILTWMPSHLTKSPELAFFLIELHESASLSIGPPFIRYAYESDKTPSMQDSTIIWQITKVFDPPGTDLLLTLPNNADAIQMISIVSGRCILRINLQSSVTLIPQQIIVFDNSTQIAVIYQKSSAIDIWKIRRKGNGSVQKWGFPKGSQYHFTRLSRTPAEQRCPLLLSEKWAFGFLGKRLNSYFHIQRKARILIMELANQVVDNQNVSSSPQKIFY